MADMMRASRVVPAFAAAATIHLVEASPVLRERQAAALPGLPVFWHDGVDGLPVDRRREFTKYLNPQGWRVSRHWRAKRNSEPR